MSLTIVDGNNVMGSRPDGWWKDRPAAMRRLVSQLGDWAAGKMGGGNRQALRGGTDDAYGDARPNDARTEI